MHLLRRNSPGRGTRRPGVRQSGIRQSGIRQPGIHRVGIRQPDILRLGIRRRNTRRRVQWVSGAPPERGPPPPRNGSVPKRVLPLPRTRFRRRKLEFNQDDRVFQDDMGKTR